MVLPRIFIFRWGMKKIRNPSCKHLIIKSSISIGERIAVVYNMDLELRTRKEGIHSIKEVPIAMNMSAKQNNHKKVR
jgi:hypothetical protein